MIPGGQAFPYLAWRICAAEQGMVFWVLSLKQGGIQFHYFTIQRLEQGMFLDRKP